MSTSNLNGFEFFRILFTGFYETKLKLPVQFVEILGDHRTLKLQLASADGQANSKWDVEFFRDGTNGSTFIRGGWPDFVRAHDLRRGYSLVFRYRACGELSVTVFDLSTCRHDCFAAATNADIGMRGMVTQGAPSRRSLPVVEPSSFTACLRQCNLSKHRDQYLNVPVVFHRAHGYARRRQVQLQMAGHSWPVSLKCSQNRYGTRSSFSYGWHQFYTDNGLQVGDTCCFKVVRETSASDDDADWEEEEEDNVSVLKVEVHRRNGEFIS